MALDSDFDRVFNSIQSRWERSRHGLLQMAASAATTVMRVPLSRRLFPYPRRRCSVHWWSENLNIRPIPSTASPWIPLASQTVRGGIG